MKFSEKGNFPYLKRSTRVYGSSATSGELFNRVQVQRKQAVLSRVSVISLINIDETEKVLHLNAYTKW